MASVTSKRLSSKARLSASVALDAPNAPAKSSRTQPSAATKSARQPFEEHASEVMRELQSGVLSLLDSVPGPTSSCAEVEKALGIDAKMAWQVLRIARADSPLAGGVSVPARVSMQKLLRAASRRRVSDAIVQRVSHAFDSFEKLLADHAESRAELQTMISAFLPEEREKQELASKQAAFQSMSQIRGIAMDATVQAYFRHPASASSAVEMVTLESFLGLRRIIPAARIGFTSEVVGRPDANARTLDGCPSEGPHSLLLPQFSSSPLPRIEVEQIESATHHWIAGQDVGATGAIDVTWAVRPLSLGRRFRRSGEPLKTGASSVIETPTKRLTFDIFVHRDLYPGSVPELLIYLLGHHGILRSFADPAREGDRLHMHEMIRPIGQGLANARLTHVPRYVEMLEHVCTNLGWNPAAFRGYRLDVQYPVHGAQYMIGFQLPEAPSGV